MSEITRTGVTELMAASVMYNGTIYLQGMVAADKTADIAEQTSQILTAIDEALACHRSDKSRILQAQIWLKDIADRAAMNAVWTEWLTPGYVPVRACVEAGLGNPAILIDIMVTAAAQ